MKLYSYRIAKFDEVSEPRSHAVKFQMKAEIISENKVKSFAQRTAITTIRGIVEFTYSPIYRWPELFKKEGSEKEINSENLRKVMYAFGIQEVEKKLQAGETSGTFELVMNQNSAPEICPFDPVRIEINNEIWHEIEVRNPIGFRA